MLLINGTYGERGWVPLTNGLDSPDRFSPKEDEMSTMIVESFREKLEALTVPSADGPFEDSYTDAMADMIGTFESALRDADDDRLAELVEHWIEHFADRAYRELADSVNKSYSHIIGRVYDQGRAKAFFDMTEALRSYKRHGLFDLRFNFLPTKP